MLQLAAARGYGLGAITAELLRLLDQYGASALQLALLEAIARDVPHPNAVRLALERAREQAARPPVLALALPEHVARRDAPMRMQSLAAYDRRYDRVSVPADNPADNPADTPADTPADIDTDAQANHPPQSNNDD